MNAIVLCVCVAVTIVRTVDLFSQSGSLFGPRRQRQPEKCQKEFSNAFQYLNIFKILFEIT